MRTGALGTSALLLLLSSSAFAAAVPGSVEPGQVEKRFQAPPAPKALPPAVIPETTAPMPPEQASRIRFVLKRVELNGATVLSGEEVAPLWSELIGHEISLADVYQLAEKITALYGNRGYLLSRAFVPPQTIADGTVRLTAVEGYVDKVVFEGKAVDRPALFDHISARIRESRPLNAAVLERYVLLANDLPGTKAQVVLKPSPDNTGAATLFMDVQHVRFDGMASLDNYGTEAIGPDQLFFEANGNSLLGLQDRTTLRVATTPSQTDELHYLFLGHAEVLSSEGTTLAVGFTQSSSKPGGDILRLLEVESRSQSVDVGISYPWVRSRSRNVTVKLGVDYRDSDTRLLGQTQSRDKQYILRTSLIYDRADSWGGLNMITATLSRGLVVANAEVQSKAGAAVDFTALTLHASRQQALSDRWSVLLRATGQAAGNPLPASELFGIGGEAVGRGYDPSEFVGDQGAGGSIDLQYRPEVEWITFMQTYAFVDGATVFHRRAVNEPESQSISSAGLGLQLATANNLAFSMEAAKPLRERASAADNDNWRLFGRVTARF